MSATTIRRTSCINRGSTIVSLRWLMRFVPSMKTIAANSPYLLLQRLTQADVTAFVAERLARQLGIDTAARTPRLHQLTTRLAEEHPFRSTKPE